MAVGHRRIPFYAVGDFFVRTKRQKLFLKNLFFKRIISLKIFYNKNILPPDKSSINSIPIAIGFYDNLVKFEFLLGKNDNEGRKPFSMLTFY
jgi:hypothetical protein